MKKRLYSLLPLLLAFGIVSSVSPAQEFVSRLFFSTQNYNQPTDLVFYEPLTPWVKENWHNSGACNAGIEFLYDAHGAKFVLKHHPTTTDALYEILGGKIGSSIDKLVNQVTLAPIAYSHKTHCATLHSYASGVEVAKVHNLLVQIRAGLCYPENLESITKHADLAKIVAINLFLNDWDCHEYNLLFDEKNNKFCAIDKGLIFHSETYLASYARDFLQKLQKKSLTSKEVYALQIVAQTLKMLLNNYPVERMYTEWMAIAEKIGCAYSQEEKDAIRANLQKNYDENKKVYEELQRLIPHGFFDLYRIKTMAKEGKEAFVQLYCKSLALINSKLTFSVT